MICSVILSTHLKRYHSTSSCSSLHDQLCLRLTSNGEVGQLTVLCFILVGDVTRRQTQHGRSRHQILQRNSCAPGLMALLSIVSRRMQAKQRGIQRRSPIAPTLSLPSGLSYRSTGWVLSALFRLRPTVSRCRKAVH